MSLLLSHLTWPWVDLSKLGDGRGHGTLKCSDVSGGEYYIGNIRRAVHSSKEPSKSRRISFNPRSMVIGSPRAMDKDTNRWRL